MSYCPKCGVELAPSQDRCPLCNTPVQREEAAASPYPVADGVSAAPATPRKRRTFAAACAILLLPSWVASVPLLLFLGGALAATAAEYLMAFFYEEALGVSFWDYRELPGNIQGRVCLPFSLAWGLLSLPLVYWVHPALSPLLQAIPRPVTWLALATLLADALLSGLLLRRTGNRHCLQWYAVRE